MWQTSHKIRLVNADDQCRNEVGNTVQCNFYDSPASVSALRSSVFCVEVYLELRISFRHRPHARSVSLCSLLYQPIEHWSVLSAAKINVEKHTNTTCVTKEAECCSGPVSFLTDKRLIHLITFNESAIINRHRLTCWHFTEANTMTCWHLGCNGNKEATVRIQIKCMYRDMFMLVCYRVSNCQRIIPSLLLNQDQVLLHNLLYLT